MVLENLAQYADHGTMVLRIALAAIFLYHGWPKLKTASVVAKGMGMPTAMVLLIGAAEFFGGLSVLLGVYARLGALAIAIVMLGALYYKIVKWKVPFSAMDKMGWEFDLILLASALFILLAGPGAFVLLS